MRFGLVQFRLPVKTALQDELSEPCITEGTPDCHVSQYGTAPSYGVIFTHLFLPSLTYATIKQ